MKKVVTLTGGSGGFALLNALRHYDLDITAVVSSFDSGGSTGILRDEYGALPQGDIRKCIVALTPDSDLRYLLTDRTEDELLKGHPFGNIMLYKAAKLWGRAEASKRLCRIFNTKGMVLPATVGDAHLLANLDDATKITGESAIDIRDVTDQRQILSVALDRKVYGLRDVIEAIKAADAVVIGPGDLYTSIIPCLLPRGIRNVIAGTSAQLIYVGNLMTKAAETRRYTIVDFLRALHAHGLRRMFDDVLVGLIPHTDVRMRELKYTYWQTEQAEPVSIGRKRDISRYAHRLHRMPLVSEQGINAGIIRHSEQKLGEALMQIINP